MENEIVINGVKYVKAESLNLDKAYNSEGKKYQIVRTYSAGVFAGYIESEKTESGSTQVVMREARRLWYWDGAASLSELSVHGVNKPENCKFPIALDRVELKQVIEVLDCTEKAKKSIEAVKIWTMNK